MTTPDASQDPLIGKLVGGRFRVEAFLAAGGMGSVYKAVQEPLGRAVALKVLRPPSTPAMDGAFGERFLLEAATIARLNHPNTVVVHDYGSTDDGTLYFVMEFLDGRTLSRFVKDQGALTSVQAIRVGLQISSSLSDAHENGVVHRDLKPGNVMITPRRNDDLFSKVLDFGLVKMTGEDNINLTQSGVMMGSPRYMAPEQVKGGEIDHRADIYSFGTLMYFLLTGRPPFNAGSKFEAMRSHVYEEPPAMNVTNPEVEIHPMLNQLVMHCLAKEPADRPQTMQQVVDALTAVAVELGDSAIFKTASSQVVMDPTGVAGRSREITVPSISGPHPAQSGPHSAQFAELPAPAPPSSRAPLAILGVVGALVLLGGIAAAYFMTRPDEAVATTLEPLAEQGSTDPIVDSPPENTIDAPPQTPPEVEPENTESGTAAAVAPAHIECEPVATVLTEDDVVLGTTPLDVPLAQGESQTVTLRANGYQDREVTIRPGVHLQSSLRRRRRSSGRNSGGAEMEPTTMVPNMTTMTTMGGAIRDPWAR